jgi:hypothetical protein
MRKVAPIFFALLVVAAVSSFAQDSTEVAAGGTVLTSEGIAGSVDKKHRNPLLSVETIVQTGNVKILVDASIPSKDYQKYPIRFDFFVNRSFVTSQIRSPELPGPVGIDVAPSIATPPFNYSVVATVLHPNRQFVTVINAAAFESNLSATFDCTLTVENAEEETAIYSASGVSTTQAGDNSFNISFTDAKDEAEETSASLSGTVNLTGTSASSSLEVTTPDGTQTVSTTGTITKTDDVVTALSLKSEDEKVVLECE